MTTLKDVETKDVETLETIADDCGWAEIKHMCRDELQIRQAVYPK